MDGLGHISSVQVVVVGIGVFHVTLLDLTQKTVQAVHRDLIDKGSPKRSYKLKCLALYLELMHQSVTVQ